MIKPLCILIQPSGETKLIGLGSAWQSHLRHYNYCAIIWLRAPTDEQRDVAQARLKMFADPKEMMAIKYIHETLRTAPSTEDISTDAKTK